MPMVWCLMALVLVPLPADGLVVDSPQAAGTICGPCAGFQEAAQGAAPVEDNAWWIPGSGGIETGNTIAFWVDDTSWTNGITSDKPGADNEGLSAAVSVPLAFIAFRPGSDDAAMARSAAEYLPVFALSARDYPGGGRNKVLQRAVWMIPAGTLVLFLALCAAFAGLVANDRYVSGELWGNFVRSDNSFSWKRVRIEATHFVQLNAKVLVVVIVYLAGNAFLLFALQECSPPASSVMGGVGVDERRMAEADEAEAVSATETFFDGDNYDAGMLLLLYAGVSGYLFLVRPSRHIFRRYKARLHGRRRFYDDLDRRRALGGPPGT